MMNSLKCLLKSSPALSITCVLLVAATSTGQETSLVKAAERAQWHRVAQLVRDGANVRQTQPDGMSALHWAAQWNRPVAVSYLVAAGCRVDLANDYGITPLAIACRYGHLNAALALLDLGADLNQTTAGNETMLMHAARAGSSGLVDDLINRGADVGASQTNGQTALMWAAAGGHLAAVDRLLVAGADPARELDSGFNAFLFAVRQGHGDVAERLLKEGIDINDRVNPKKNFERAPRKGMSALMFAVESGHFELALRLVDWGADPNDQRSGFGPLHALSWVRRPSRGDNPAGDPPPVGSGDVGSLQFARELVDRGANVNLQLDRGRYSKARLNPKGATPMLYAAYTGDLPYARLLRDLGGDLRIANADGTTPLLAAAGVGIFVADEYPGTEAETLAMVQQLVQWGADINAVDSHEETVMHGAAYRSFAKVVDRLVELGADPNVWQRKNSIGSTPRQVAAGKRPGSFKPNQSTMDAIEQALTDAGMEIIPWQRREDLKKDWADQ